MATVNEEASRSPLASRGEREAEKRFRIEQESDITVACQYGRFLAAQLDFSLVDQTAVIIAIKEVAYNVLKYAGQGQLILTMIRRNDLHSAADDTPIAGSSQGLMVIAQDKGPGIIDVAQAMQEGYSTGRGLGLGLPGAKRLMDEFQIDSEGGQGTKVVMKKWLKLIPTNP
jgi:serine/threonine-protein kinase RsbT